MRVPISTTQKWYYLRGTEDKDVEYGKVFIACVAPLSNVSGGSKTTLVVRMRWTFEFSYPDMPSASLPDEEVFASAPNYFSDSSSDWKEGKYLTFKWHEGGNITEFPEAKTGTLYKIGLTQVGYYASNGVLLNTKFAVCVGETTETGQPMLAPVKDAAAGKAWLKDKADSHLIPYYAAGPWVSPENPPWHEQTTSVQLLLTREDTTRSAMTDFKTKTSVEDQAVSSSASHLNKLQQTLYGTRKGDKRDALFGLRAQSAHALVNLSDTYNVLLQRGDYDPQDPELGIFKTALEKLTQLSFGINPLAEKLNVFNWDPVRSGLSSSTSFEEVGLDSGQQASTENA